MRLVLIKLKIKKVTSLLVLPKARIFNWLPTGRRSINLNEKIFNYIVVIEANFMAPSKLHRTLCPSVRLYLLLLGALAYIYKCTC